MRRHLHIIVRIAALVLVATVVALLSVAPLRGQLPGFNTQRAESTDVNEAVATSPRTSLQNFLRLADAKDWNGAAGYLTIPSGERARATDLARRLKQVLDQRVAFDLREISPLAVGDTTDGDLNADQIGIIAGPDGEASIRLVRAANRTPQRWMFSAQTVSHIDGWYEDFGAPWLRDRLSPTLMREGPLHLFLWQWIGLALAVPLLLVLAWIIGEVLRSLLVRVAVRTTTDWDDHLIEGLGGPFRLWIAALAITPLVSVLELNARVSAFINAGARGLVLMSLFWGLLRIIKLAQSRMESNAFQHGQVQARTLIPLLGNILRVTLVIVALLVALSQFGYPVGTLLTTLGIGGIAFALAAQKTVEHLFGSISLAADKAFRVGDWVRAGGTEGAVERIGLRSTSFRTNDRTIIRVPNGRLAEDRIETFGERDRMLLRTDLDLTYATRAAQFEAIRTQIERVLRDHPKIWPDTVRVFVVGFTESSVRLNVMSWFQTTNYDEFLLIRHKLFMEFMRIVEANGSSFAFPTRTLHVTGDGAVGVSPQELVMASDDTPSVTTSSATPSNAPPSNASSTNPPNPASES